MTPKAGLDVDFDAFVKLPVFVNLTWISDDNLKTSLEDSQTIRVGRTIKDTEVVHSVSCYNMSDGRLDEFLKEDSVLHLNVLRGDRVSEHQKYQHANELIEAIKGKMTDVKELTIFAAGYPEKHPESSSLDSDLLYLRRKVDAGVDVILTQVVYSAEIFVEFLCNCRKANIHVPILPGLYIPHNFKELNRLIEITKIQMPELHYEAFKSRRETDEDFQTYSVIWMMTLIKEIKLKSPEFIPGYHFYTMNNFDMIRKCLPLMEF
ncbi:unnamed protein product [Diamesa tonsa]